MRYKCMCFGWYQELLREVQVDDLAAAEMAIVAMLDRGGMIAHAYRETDLEHPELVGRHARLRSFFGENESDRTRRAPAPSHEIERFLIDASGLDSWSRANDTGSLLEQRWSVIDLWAAGGFGDSYIYGKARLIGADDARAFRSPGKSNAITVHYTA